MNLFIVESPNKCGKLKSFLGSDFNVMASVGHINEIPKKGINIDIKNQFEPKYEIIEDKKENVAKIKKVAQEAEKIFLATDMDREGEAISYHIFNVLDKSSQQKCKRVTFNEITKNAVLEALKKTRDIDGDLVSAQKARQVLDRLIGYKVSPVLWFGVSKGTSAGRVQSIALKLVCMKEKEIQAFKPQDYWFVEALLNAENGEFWAKVITKDKENKYLEEKIADNDLERLKSAKYVLDSIEKKERKVEANPPFITSSLQTTCSSLFGWSAAKTSKIAQGLYEQGVVTYIRSDSFAIAKEALDEVRGFIKKSCGDDYLPKVANIYTRSSKAAAQEAHECIRPTHVADDGESVAGTDDKKLYNLIRDRFIACQMNPMIVDTVTYNIKTNTDHALIAKGQTVRFDGWYKVYDYSKTKEEILPVAKEKENLTLKEIKKTKHTTQPPSRYNEGSLIKKMEAEGVGRPSTYAGIMSNIQAKAYVEIVKKSKGALQATELGMKVYDYLEPHFKDFFMDIKFTSALEDDLDLIAKGEKKYLQVVEATYNKMMEEIKKIDSNKDGKKEDKTGEKCIVCKEGDIIKKVGRFGSFYTCNKYPECKTIYKQNEDGSFEVFQKVKAKKTGKSCPNCEKAGKKGELLERISKDGNKFLGCSNYPRCKFTESCEEK